VDRVPVPLIASGGAASAADMVAAVVDGGADAVLAASVFHRRLVSIANVKLALAAAGLPVRRVPVAA
jgi:cyclase